MHYYNSEEVVALLSKRYLPIFLSSFVWHGEAATPGP